MSNDRIDVIASGMRRLPILSLLLAAIAVGVQFSPAALGGLQYDRAAIIAGEVWRIATCHLAHWSFDHLLWDAAALVVLGALCEVDHRRAFRWCVAISAVMISLAMWFLRPDVDPYRGLSGIDSALFTLLAVTILRASWADRRFGWTLAATLVLCGFAGKVGYEVATSRTLFVDSAAAGMVPIPLAHVVGGLIGAICGIAAAGDLRTIIGRPTRSCIASFSPRRE